MQQYLELGDQSQACITIPESCGAQGGAISVWVKLIGCQNGGGIISSQDPSQSAVIIACSPTELRYMTIKLEFPECCLNSLSSGRSANIKIKSHWVSITERIINSK